MGFLENVAMTFPLTRGSLKLGLLLLLQRRKRIIRRRRLQRMRSSWIKAAGRLLEELQQLGAALILEFQLIPQLN
jgi:hypothetical protein